MTIFTRLNSALLLLLALAPLAQAVQYCRIDDDDCVRPPPPPSTPPTTPTMLTYTPFSEGNLVNVMWSPVARVNTGYELQITDASGTRRVYFGTATSTPVAVSGEGDVQFQVRACNTVGCSPFRSYEYSRISFGPDRRSGRSQASTEMAIVNGEAPFLGMGFDQLRQESTQNLCADLSPAAIEDLENRQKTFKFDLVKTRDELATSLNMSSTLGVGVTYGSFGGSYSGKKEIVANSTRIEETTMLAVSLRDQFHSKQITNYSQIAVDSYHTGLLQAGNANDFRRFCGDAFVRSVVYGREMNLVFQLTSLDFSRDEIRNQTQNLKISIGNWFNAGRDTSTRTQIAQKYSSYNVRVLINSVGSSVAVSKVTSLDGALQYIQDFESEPRDAMREAAIDIFSSDYLIPTGIANYPDYHSVLSRLQRWHQFDRQVVERCYLFDGTGLNAAAYAMDNDARTKLQFSMMDDCFRAKRMIQSQIQNCEMTNKWGDCIHPDAAICLIGDQNCVTFAQRFPVWLPTTASLGFHQDIGASWGGDTRRYGADACLTNGHTILDQRLGSVDCAGNGGCPALRKGVVVTTTSLINATNAFNLWDSARSCLHAEVTLDTPSRWGGGGHVHQTQVVNGVTGENRMYQF